MPRISRQLLAGCAGVVLAGAAHAATVTVTGNGDTVAVDGVVTLREAIDSINGSANVNVDVVAIGTYGAADTIHFAIPGAGVHTIQPASQLVITKPVTINGYSQSGSSANSLAVGNNAVLTIELDGSNAGSVPGGLLKLTGGSSTVRGLVINRSLGTGGYGLELSGAAATRSPATSSARIRRARWRTGAAASPSMSREPAAIRSAARCRPTAT